MAELDLEPPEHELDLVQQLETLRRDGNPLALYDRAHTLMRSGRTEPRLRYLQVLALAQMGDTERAAQLYELYQLGDLIEDEDALALRGRIFKDRAQALSGVPRAAEFKRASEAYLQAYQVHAGYFPGINAATTAWAAGDLERFRDLAADVLAHPELNPPTTFFAAASRAEALILLARADEAGEVLTRWLSSHEVGYGERASAYHQLNWLCSAAGLGQALLGSLRPPPVITFTGHMFQAGGEAEAHLVCKIHDQLSELGSTIAYGALACGADILIAEEILRRGGELHVVLPFISEDFVEISVRPGGESWVERYQFCLAHAASLTLATRMNYVSHDSQFTYGAQLAMGLARLRASQLSAASLQLAVWDGGAARKHSGAAVDIDHWGALGLETRVIDPGAVDRRLPQTEKIDPDKTPRRVVRAIIFTDYTGYSQLAEMDVPLFNRDIMGRIAVVLNNHDKVVCSRNTWGDALYAVIEEPVEAAEIALEIVEALEGVRLFTPDHVEPEGMRVGLHFGPVYQEIDPVTGLDSFYGTEVTLTARIEPKVAPGAVYTTQAFAAMLAASRPDRFRTRYIGRVELAKGYGEAPIYQLERGLRPAA
jgi:adenylate cyclase